MKNRHNVFVKPSPKPKCPRCRSTRGVRPVRDFRNRVLRTAPRVYWCTCPLMGPFVGA